MFEFLGKENKNEFEKKLMINAQKIRYNYNPIDYVNYLKGLYHLQENEYETALKYLSNSEVEHMDSYSVGAYVDARVFSNGLNVCYQNCDKKKIFTDSVFLTSIFEIDDKKNSEI